MDHASVNLYILVKCASSAIDFANTLQSMVKRNVFTITKQVYTLKAFRGIVHYKNCFEEEDCANIVCHLESCHKTGKSSSFKVSLIVKHYRCHANVLCLIIIKLDISPN